MKWYFASRMRHKEKISKIVEFLKSKNQEITYEWSKFESLKPYNENSEQCSKIAKEISLALENTDIFALISDEAGTDMFIELGMMLGQIPKCTNKKIYAVGKFNNRSLMHFHPKIKRVESIKDVFSKEGIELSEELSNLNFLF